MCGSPDAPKPPPPPPPPPSEVSPEVKKSRSNERRRAAASQGTQDTILTSSQGVQGQANTGRTILG